MHFCKGVKVVAWDIRNAWTDLKTTEKKNGRPEAQGSNSIKDLGYIETHRERAPSKAPRIFNEEAN